MTELELHHQFAETKMYLAVCELDEIESKQLVLHLYHAYLEQFEYILEMDRRIKKLERKADAMIKRNKNKVKC